MHRTGHGRRGFYAEGCGPSMKRELNCILKGGSSRATRSKRAREADDAGTLMSESHLLQEPKNLVDKAPTRPGQLLSDLQALVSKFTGARPMSAA